MAEASSRLEWKMGARQYAEHRWMCCLHHGAWSWPDNFWVQGLHARVCRYRSADKPSRSRSVIIRVARPGQETKHEFPCVILVHIFTLAEGNTTPPIDEPITKLRHVNTGEGSLHPSVETFRAAGLFLPKDESHNSTHFLLCTNTSTHTRSNTSPHAHVHGHVDTHYETLTRTCLDGRTNRGFKRFLPDTHAHTHACTHARTNADTNECTHAQTPTYACTHAHKHTGPWVRCLERYYV